MRVAILGGAFDPVHHGHLEIAGRLMRGESPFDAVWLMPCVQHGFGKRMASFRDRFAMLRLATFGMPGVTASDYEFRHDLSGRTIDLIDALADDPELAAVDFTFVLGQDAADRVREWQDCERVVTRAKFLVLPRRGYATSPVQDWYHRPPHRFLSSLRVTSAAASHLVRAAIARGDAGVRKHLPLLVHQWITAKELYGCVATAAAA